MCLRTKHELYMRVPFEISKPPGTIHNETFTDVFIIDEVCLGIWVIRDLGVPHFCDDLSISVLLLFTNNTTHSSAVGSACTDICLRMRCLTGSHRRDRLVFFLRMVWFAGNSTSVTLFCAAMTRKSSSSTTSCPSMLWTTSASPMSSPPSVSGSHVLTWDRFVLCNRQPFKLSPNHSSLQNTGCL